jgi:hypothetical protein
MADEFEDPDAAADRLEAALERIARLAAMRPMAPPPRSDADLSVAEIAERLDSLITRLRAAIGPHAQPALGPQAQPALGPQAQPE